MIADIIFADHQGAREALAVAGNAAFDAHDERAGEFRRFAHLWESHVVMMEDAVYPVLAECLGRDTVVTAARDSQREIGALVAGMAERSEAGDHGPWMADFERLKALFERQVDREARLVSLVVHVVPAEAIARMSRRARAIRDGMA